jgi:hypothetical protein
MVGTFARILFFLPLGGPGRLSLAGGFVAGRELLTWRQPFHPHSCADHLQERSATHEFICLSSPMLSHYIIDATRLDGWREDDGAAEIKPREALVPGPTWNRD